MPQAAGIMTTSRNECFTDPICMIPFKNRENKNTPPDQAKCPAVFMNGKLLLFDYISSVI